MSTATCSKSSRTSKTKCKKYVYFFGNGKAEGDGTEFYLEPYTP